MDVKSIVNQHNEWENRVIKKKKHPIEFRPVKLKKFCKTLKYSLEVKKERVAWNWAYTSS